MKINNVSGFGSSMQDRSSSHHSQDWSAFHYENKKLKDLINLTFAKLLTVKIM